QQLILQKASLADIFKIIEQVTSTQIPEQYTPSRLDSLPFCSAHVRQALIAARTVADMERSRELRNHHLLYGLLSVEECSLIQALQNLGIDKQDINLSPRISSSKDKEIMIAGYIADLPKPDDPDLLDFTKDVEVLCSVLAAHKLEPPLSLGLFGEWGSGKSHFMKLMKKRITELRDKARAGNEAFCSNIVQLEFNAWHFIDTNLWASLTSEIFEGLAGALAQEMPAASEQDNLKLARTRLLAATSNAKELLTNAEQKRRDAEIQLQESQQHLEKLQRNQVDIAASLTPEAIIQGTYTYAMKNPQLKAQVEEAAKALNIPTAKMKSAELQAQLLELEGILGKAKAAWLWLCNIKNFPLLLLWLGICVLLAPAFYKLVPLFQAQLGEWIAKIVWLLGGITTFLAPIIKKAHGAVSIIDNARNAHQTLINDTKQKMEDDLKKQQEQLQEKLVTAQQQVDEASTTVTQLETQINSLRADRQLYEFIKQRYESTDYTKHLGIIARARNDFERLSEHLQKVNNPQPEEQESKTNSLSTPLPRIDRIILYIDDLDRCPERKVMDVLQAIHLLLAFPLFVVVVGVDPCWLLHSLKQHSKAFQEEFGEEHVAWQSTPLHYLEKIFQIPFTLRPMNSTGFGNIIDNLIKQSNEDDPKSVSKSDIVIAKTSDATSTSTSASANQQSDNTLPDQSVSVASTNVNVAQTSSTNSIDSLPSENQYRHLEINSWESKFMKEFFPLIRSPRTAKRYVNTYRLLRASVPESQLAAFIGNEDHGQYRAVLLLLAILIGYPEPATDILHDLIERKHPEDWWQFIDEIVAMHTNGDIEMPSNIETERWKDLEKKLQQLRALIPERQSCQDFVEWARRVARYSFQSGRILRLHPFNSAND
ncbi:MAG: P-loop NTPase fold protein, partial [Acidobacteriota bacterium]